MDSGSETQGFQKRKGLCKRDAPFSDIGIPYIYFEANNWLNGLPVETENHGLIMHSDKDDLSFIENEYGNRAKDTMANYSHLLHLVLQENNWE